MSPRIPRACRVRDERVAREMLPRSRQRVVFRTRSGRTIVRVAHNEKHFQRLLLRRDARLFVGGQR